MKHQSQVGTYFTEVESSGQHRYVPRSIQVDLEVGVLDRVDPSSYIAEDLD